MEGVELYMLGAMDVVCQFCGDFGFESEKRNGQVCLENYAAMEIRHIQETYSIPQYTLTWRSYLLGVLHKHDSSRNISVNSILNFQWPH